MESGQAWVTGRKAVVARERVVAGPLRPLVSERTLVAGMLALLAACCAWVASASQAGDWRPAWLLVSLVCFAVLSELGCAQFEGVFVSNSFLALVLAATLLGPGAAAVVAVSTLVIDATVYRKPTSAIVVNGAMYMTLVVAASAAFMVVPARAEAATVALAVFGIGVLGAALNVLMLAAVHRARFGLPPSDTVRTMLAPTIPFQVVSATLAAAAAQFHLTDQPALFGGVLAILLGSELLLRSAVASRSREKQVFELTRQRSELLEQALEADQVERAWLASHLHDETLQLLAAAQQELAEDDTERAGALLEDAVEELRHTLTHFHPASLDEIGLEPALTVYAGQLARRDRAEYAITVDGTIGTADSAVLYALGRELLANAAKHAHATRVALAVSTTEHGVRLEVTDDGEGFDTAAPVSPGHIGLAAVRRRVSARGGRLEICSAPGRGTTVTVKLPPAPGVSTHSRV